ncbi:3-oxoacyl-ACP synthase III family protein [Streptomyces shenzhenensis]|uniref:3-oxoacyl-ACP synthase III family protein n=1 Tax=Streptomyces shenzhenensis TaxID=943815 RepID=UPI001604F0D7|nr:ketoacyl-ACP synthase III [Streptomyces shenzhenensis]
MSSDFAVHEQRTSIGITGIGTYLPPRVRTFADTATMVGMPEQWVLERTGIRSRHVADDDQATSDMAAQAVSSALMSAGLTAEQLGLILVATTTPDEPCPSTACRVQGLIGAAQAVAMDVAAACSGWLFAAKVAQAWLTANPEVEHAVVVGSETYSRFLNPDDRATAALFGDGAAATVVSRVAGGEGFAPIILGSDGSRGDFAWIPGGGSRIPASAESVRERSHTVHMDGRAARVFVYEAFPKLVTEALARTGTHPEELAAVVAHQPNPILLRRAYANTALPPDKLVVTGDRVGNLGAGALPHALNEAAVSKKLVPGDKVLMVAFGAGLTWGSTVLTWSGTADHALS